MNKLKISFVVFSLVLLLTGSCHISPKQDLSLTAKEYRKLGMPDPNKTWTNYDFVNANLSLSSLHVTNPLSLPRKHSKKSGAFFSRIVDKENLSFVNDAKISLHDRALLIQHFQKLYHELSNLYTNTSKDKPYYKMELIDLYVFGLFINEKMLELAGKIMNSKEESDKNLQNGQKFVQYNYLRMIYMLLEEQLKSNNYPSKDLDRLSTAVSRSLTDNQGWMVPDARQKIAVEIRNVIEKSPSRFVKKNYRKTLEVLK
jgi:hypothetical protein